MFSWKGIIFINDCVEIKVSFDRLCFLQLFVRFPPVSYVFIPQSFIQEEDLFKYLMINLSICVKLCFSNFNVPFSVICIIFCLFIFILNAPLRKTAFFYRLFFLYFVNSIKNKIMEIWIYICSVSENLINLKK